MRLRLRSLLYYCQSGRLAVWPTSPPGVEVDVEDLDGVHGDLGPDEDLSAGEPAGDDDLPAVRVGGGRRALGARGRPRPRPYEAAHRVPARRRERRHGQPPRGGEVVVPH